MTPTIGALFAGYGGLEVAVEAVTGGRTVWYSEIEHAAVTVHEAHWPGVPNLGDISAVNWSQVEPVDVICGGFPCTDISVAGQRAGLEGTHSGLWFSMLDAIRVLRPRLVVAENVAAIAYRGLSTVIGGLAELGYDATWGCLRASAIGAPHRRDRWFMAATSDASGERLWQHPTGPSPQEGPHTQGRHLTGCGAPSRPATDWGPYRPAIDHWARVIGRPAPEPLDDLGRPSAELKEWMMGLERGWVTGQPISYTAQGKMLGNGCMSQQAEAALRMLLAVAS